MFDIFGKTIVFIAGIIAIVFVIALVIALPVMWLWNWLMPEIFGLKEIGFFQAWGILMLSGLLFRSSSSSSSSSSSN